MSDDDKDIDIDSEDVSNAFYFARQYFRSVVDFS